MGSVPIGVPGGQATGQKNMGMPVPNSGSGRNGMSPITSTIARGSVPGGGPVNGVNKPITSPVASPIVTGKPPSTFQGPGQQNHALSTPATQTPPSSATATAATTPAGNNGNTLAGYTPQQTQQLQKQLTDIYGKGEGGLLGSLLMNLGSNDSSYMDAYHQAMSKSTAEGMATLDTSLGNAGISANSSAAAIEKGDYMSGVVSQEGLQEQQLIQQQQQEAIGLTQGLQNDSRDENSTSWLDTAAQVVGIAGTVAGDVTGLGAIGKGVSSLFSKTIPTLSGGGGAGSAGPGAQLPGAISGGYAGPIPLSIG